VDTYGESIEIRIFLKDQEWKETSIFGQGIENQTQRLL